MSCVHVYTGNGKGKTTAALGLLLRACGASLNACVFQFLKKGDYSELKTLGSRFLDVPVKQFGSGTFIDRNNILDSDRKLAMDGFSLARDAVLSGAYDLVILDEINGAMDIGLIDVADVLAMMRARPERTEIVLTGRNAPQAVIDAADLCTEMREIKHYFQAGVPARQGIEL